MQSTCIPRDDGTHIALVPSGGDGILEVVQRCRGLWLDILLPLNTIVSLSLINSVASDY